MQSKETANVERRDGISPELDELSATLMGQALDMLAEGSDLNVLLVVQDAAGQTSSYEFSDDGPEELLEGAREKVAQVDGAVRYAIAYEAAVADEDGAYQDALLVEFGERGYKSFSAYCLIDGKGAGDGFMYTDPAPAGELEPIL